MRSLKVEVPKVKKYLLVVMIMILTLLRACAQQGQEVKELKVALVDQQRLWEESQQAKDYQTQLNNKVTALREKYAAESENLSEAERSTEEGKIYQKINTLREDLKQKFKQDIAQAVAQIAKSEGYDIVLNKDEVRFGGNDITTEVLTQLKNE